MARKYDFLQWYNISDDMICLVLCQCDIDEFIWVWHWAARWAQLVRRLMISHNQHMAGWPLLASKVALNSRVQKILNKVDFAQITTPKRRFAQMSIPNSSRQSKTNISQSTYGGLPLLVDKQKICGLLGNRNCSHAFLYEGVHKLYAR